MNLFCRLQISIKVASLECSRGIPDDECSETEITAHSCCSGNAMVGRQTDDDKGSRFPQLEGPFRETFR